MFHGYYCTASCPFVSLKNLHVANDRFTLARQILRKVWVQLSREGKTVIAALVADHPMNFTNSSWSIQPSIGIGRFPGCHRKTVKRSR